MKAMKSPLKYMLLAAPFVWSACGSNQNKSDDFFDYENAEFVYIEEEEEDLGSSGIIIRVADNDISILTESGDTLNFSLDRALAAHHVYGGFEMNDHVVVTTESDGVAQELLNLNTLVGRWVYKNVAGEETGLEIVEGGAANSINYDTQNYRNWATYKTRVMFTWSGDGSDGTSELIDTCQIRYLSKDTLKMVSQYDDNLEIMYYRQSSKPVQRVADTPAEPLF